MTARERRLLTLSLAALALVLDLRVLVLPAMEEQAALRTVLEQTREEQTARARRIQAVPEMAQAISTHEKALAEASAPYYPYLSTEEMDRILTDLLLSHGLEPRELALEAGRSGTLAPYLSGKSPKLGGTYGGESLLALLEAGEAQAIAHGGKDYLYLAQARLTARGSGEAWLSLLDDVAENYPALRAASFEISEQGQVRAVFDLFLYGP